MAVKWNNSLATGIDQIDQQHQKLFEIVDQLTAACFEARGKEELGKVLNFMGNYVIEHFRDEERYMLQYKYPDYPAHKKVHDEFTAKINELLHQFKTEGVNLKILIATNKTIYEWLTNHIMNMDKAFGNFKHKQK